MTDNNDIALKCNETILNLIQKYNLIVKNKDNSFTYKQQPTTDETVSAEKRKVTLNEADKVEDPTNGATHFHATYINWQPGWKRVKDSVQHIGNHVFYRTKPKEEK